MREVFILRSTLEVLVAQEDVLIMRKNRIAVLGELLQQEEKA